MILKDNVTAWESVYGDPIEFDFTIEPDAESSLTTIVGGSVQVAFVGKAGRVTGTATITGPLSGHGSFAGTAVAEGVWELQIRATPPAGQPQTIRRIGWTVHKSAFTA